MCPVLNQHTVIGCTDPSKDAKIDHINFVFREAAFDTTSALYHSIPEWVQAAENAVALAPAKKNMRTRTVCYNASTMYRLLSSEKFF